MATGTAQAGTMKAAQAGTAPTGALRDLAEDTNAIMIHGSAQNGQERFAASGTALAGH